jgi:hypothetical protein
MSKFREIWQLVQAYRTSIVVNFLFNILNAVFSLFTFLAVVPFLYIPKSVSYPLTMEDENIQKTVNRIKEMVEMGFKAPTEIINKFKKHFFKMNI